MIAAEDHLVTRKNAAGVLSWKLIAFYIGIPLSIAVYGAINNWEIQQTIGYGGTLAFYLSHSFVPWWITSISTYGSMHLLKRWQPAPIMLMVIGALLGCLLTIPYTNWITQAFEQFWPTQSFDGFTTHVFSTDFFIFYARVVAIWIAVNLIFDRYVGLPRYRYQLPEQPPSESHDSLAASSPGIIQQPAFLARLPEATTIDQVLAISAEQHYIRVYTKTKDHMILYRFSDAVREIDGKLGMQVHRSWWISRTAINSIRQSAKKFFVHLDNEIDVPVSTPYQGMLKEFARSAQIPIRPAPLKDAS